MTLTTPEAKTAAERRAEIEREIDHARTRGALQQIVIPPCPELVPLFGLA